MRKQYQAMDFDQEITRAITADKTNVLPKPPEGADWNSESGKKWMQEYQKVSRELDQVVQGLSKGSHFWLVGSTMEKLRAKITNMTPEEYKDLRSKVAQFLVQLREAQKIQKAVDATANEIINGLLKG